LPARYSDHQGDWRTEDGNADREDRLKGDVMIGN
jgi:hypothetical protein